MERRGGIALALATRDIEREDIVQRLPVAVLLVLSGLSGCVIVGDPSCTGGGAALVVTPGVVVVAVGQSVTPTANDSWCDHGQHAYGSPTWSLLQPADSVVVRLDSTTGRITGLRAGTTTVVARSSASGATTSVPVTVR